MIDDTRFKKDIKIKFNNFYFKSQKTATKWTLWWDYFVYADEDHMICFKASEQQLNGPRGHIIL